MSDPTHCPYCEVAFRDSDHLSKHHCYDALGLTNFRHGMVMTADDIKRISTAIHGLNARIASLEALRPEIDA